MAHTGTEHLVIGVSGGLDSTLATLIASRAVDMLALPRERIIAISMPCFGTTERTRTNSEILEVTIGNKKQNIFYPCCGENVYKFENIHSQQMMQEDIKNYPEVEELYQAWLNGLV